MNDTQEPTGDDLPDHGHAQENQPEPTYSSELGRYVSELEQANRLFDTSIRAAVHDLKSPLAAIQMELSLLLSRSAELPDEIMQPLRETIRACEAMRCLIDTLPRAARTSIEERELEEIDLNVLLEVVLAGQRSAIERTQTQITVDCLPTIRGHRERIRQLLSHLITNAIDHCQARPPVVHMTAEYCGPDWVFCVEVNGAGLLPEDRERAFDAFACPPDQPPTSAQYPPNLRLALCKRVVQAHGGHIWIESQPSGPTTILFTLPARPRKLDT